MKFSLRAAGEEYQKVGLIDIASASLRDQKPGQKVSVNGNIVALESQPTERVYIDLETSESVENIAFRMGVTK